MMDEPVWEAYDPQQAWAWHDWAVARIEELESRIQKADDYIDTAIYTSDPDGRSLVLIQEILALQK